MLRMKTIFQQIQQQKASRFVGPKIHNNSNEVEYKSITSYEFSGLSFPVNPFQVNVSFLYPLKISANKWFSDVLRRHRKVT